MTMVDLHEHVNLHILNIQAPMKPLMKKNTTKLTCGMKGGRPFWTKHSEAKGGRMGGAETTLEEAVGTQCWRN